MDSRKHHGLFSSKTDKHANNPNIEQINIAYADINKDRRKARRNLQALYGLKNVEMILDKTTTEHEELRKAYKGFGDFITALEKYNKDHLNRDDGLTAHITKLRNHHTGLIVSRKFDAETKQPISEQIDSDKLSLLHIEFEATKAIIKSCTKTVQHSASQQPQPIAENTVSNKKHGF